MKSSIVVGLEDDAKKEMESCFKGSKMLRDRLSVLLKNKIESSNKDSRSESGYENPSWPFKQADYRGYERAMQEVISLLAE